jgi:hypothetical protein
LAAGAGRPYFLVPAKPQLLGDREAFNQAPAFVVDVLQQAAMRHLA